MVMLGDVRRWRFFELALASTNALDHRDTLVGLQDELDATARPPSWVGPTADAATRRHDELGELLRRTAAQAAAVGRALDEASGSLNAVTNQLHDSEELAATHQFTLGDDNVVRDLVPNGIVLPEAEVAQRVLVRDELVTRVTQICATAADTDADLAAVLRAAAQDQVDDGEGTSLAGAAAAGNDAGAISALAPPPDGTPVQNAAWWNSLSAEQQDQVVAEHPETVGNMDGVPAAVRDEANRARLDDERASLEAEADRLQGNLDDNLFGGTFTNDDARLEHVQNRLRDLDQIEETLQGDDRHLLLLDNSGEMVKAAIANGDVDTADHVSVFTSGLNSTTRDSLGGYDGDMDDLRAEAENQLSAAGHGDQTVATVTWMGYEAPQMGGFTDDLDFGDTVTSDDAAQDGAGRLSGFLNGIDASRTEDPHLTALGHSYGSLTTSLALQQGTGVDDVVLYGSPGLGTDDVSDLGVPDGHVFVSEAKNDPVADLAYFGRDPNQLDGVTTLSAEAGTTPTGEERTQSTGHSEYVVDGSMSQYNMGTVITGHPGDAVTGGYYGAGDVINWWP